MGKLLKVWLRLLEETEKPGMFYDKSAPLLLEVYRKDFEERSDPKHLMQAFNTAGKYRFPVPAWVIEGLDKTFDKYRPLPKQNEETEWLTSAEVISRLGVKGVNDLTLAKHISSGELGHYIRLGKWLSEEAQTARKTGKVIYQGWTWIDRGEITFDRILENLDDLAYSMDDVVEFEKKHGLTSQTLRESTQKTSTHTDFAFFKTGSAWEIIFEGREFTGLKGPGFQYLHYLIDKFPGAIEVDDLFKIFGKNTTGKKIEDLGLDDTHKQTSNKDGVLDHLIDKKTIAQIHEKMEDLKDQMEEATKNNDTGKVNKKRQEIESLKDYLNNSQFKGRIKTYIDDRTRMVRNIGKAMQRAVEKLGNDKSTYEHFLNAFKPFTSFKPKRYNPAKPIVWKLE